MANRDRLTGLDAAFLDLEARGAHMHVAGILVFDGEPPAYEDLLRTIESRLDLVPRYRQKLAEVPFGQGRPEWVDDPHFNLRYHVRHSAAPRPGRRRRARADRRAPVRAAPRPRQAAVGAEPRRGPRGGGRRAALRDHLEDASRARRRRLRRRHHLRPLRRRAGARVRAARRGRRRAGGAAVGGPPRADVVAAARPRAGRARDGPRRGPARAPRRRPRAVARGAARRRGGRRHRGDGARGLQPGAGVAAQRADRPAPALHVGRRRPSTSSRRSRTRSAAR